MYAKRIILLWMGCLFSAIVFAQGKPNEQKAAINSLQLYNEKKWKELLEYGKTSIAEGTDFPLLRMRMGYAAFALGKYSESLKQYENVYDNDKQNYTALYYAYLNNLYLNNITAARFYAGKMPEETRESEKIIKYKLSAINMEYSYKAPDLVSRGNAQFGRLGLNVQLGYRLELQQVAGFYNQIISEPKLTAVTNNNNINIAQKEYYAKLIFAASGKLSLIGGLHYIYTPFNNFKYNNFAGFGGVKYATPYVHLQGLVHVASIGDSAYNQFDAAITAYPLGNMKLYTITRASYGKNFILTQVAGVEILKNTWLEGNITAGQYIVLLDNDALYLFNDIDTKKFKAGGSMYIFLAKKVILTVNYNFEKKQRYRTTSTYFYQHSTTGGLIWNF
ncbi:MAG: hypothetical protein HZB42_01000 [Sphingobacteriales bacterium]|nr:hypothetical protein [Sphingobacteriales bacterium]